VYDLGDTVGLATTLRDSAGALTNATTVALTITKPDGTTETPAVTNPPSSTGQYTKDYVPATAGRYVARWTFTTPTAAYVDTFEVAPADPGYIVSLADAKTHLNITSTTHDEELRGIISAATVVVEHFVGPIARRTYTEIRQAAGWSEVALEHGPILSVTSLNLLSDGTNAHDLTDLDFSNGDGVLRSKTGAALPTSPWKITYVAGRTEIPANIRLAALIIVAHMWRTQRGGAGRVDFGGDEIGTVTTGSGYLVPFRALSLLEASQQQWGFA
jgi:hypothetical protein